MNDQEYISLREFEQYRGGVETRLSKVENEVSANKVELNTKLDKLLDKFDSLRTDMYSYRNSLLLRIIGWGASFILGGGGMVGIMQAFHLLK